MLAPRSEAELPRLGGLSAALPVQGEEQGEIELVELGTVYSTPEVVGVSLACELLDSVCEERASMGDKAENEGSGMFLDWRVDGVWELDSADCGRVTPSRFCKCESAVKGCPGSQLFRGRAKITAGSKSLSTGVSDPKLGCLTRLILRPFLITSRNHEDIITWMRTHSENPLPRARLLAGVPQGSRNKAPGWCHCMLGVR